MLGSLLLGLTGSAAAEPPILQTLRAGHPRVYLTSDDLAALRQRVKDDPVAAEMLQKLQARATKILTDKPVTHTLIGPRLLDQSRRALDRLSTWALVYQLTGDKRFLDRAREEMLAAAAFPDWNPSHFLDVAEMTNAMAIGYDWLYNDLADADRQTIRRAIVKLGLEADAGKGWWHTVNHNWNQVCHGGLAAGALAVADTDPERSEQVLRDAIEHVPAAMASYAPDGGWAEGPGYWSYATTYNVYLIAGLRSALGEDFGLSKKPGFADAGGFLLQSIGPSGGTFNYADAGAGRWPRESCLWYLAMLVDQPWLAAYQQSRAVERPGPFDLLWYRPVPAGPEAHRLPLCALYKGVNVAYLRSGWDNATAIWVGFKGGDNKANHSHLDLGTFVLDYAGQRFALDLGGDDYNLPGYFGKERWTYFRLNTQSHNTLTIDGQNQSPKAAALIVEFATRDGNTWATADLSQAYSVKATRVTRRVELSADKRITVRDEVDLKQPGEVRWSFYTAAQAELAGDTAKLTMGKAQLSLRIVQPQGATFILLPADAPKPQKQQPDVHNVAMSLKCPAGKSTIEVVVEPR